MKTYSYKDCLQTAFRVNWRIDEVLGDRRFDFTKRALPNQLSAAPRIRCLDEEEKIKLTHVEMGAYAHIFGYVEHFIAPQITEQAQNHEVDNREAFEALSNFVAEEVKHMNLFRRVRQRIDEQLGFALKLLDGEEQVVQYVISKNSGAVLLLIDCIEWFTQLHYLSGIRDAEGLDELTRNIFRAHWLEEAQHAKMDHMETLKIFAAMNDSERDQAITDLIELVQAVDGLLQKQSAYDVENLSQYLGRSFTTEEQEEIYREVLNTKRWVFIESGVTHPKFAELFQYISTPAQQERVQLALAA